MKIIQIMPGKVCGGAEQVILDLSKALVMEGHELVVYIRNSAAVKARMEQELPFKVLPFAFSLDPRAVKELANELKRSDADVINVHNSAFVPMAIRAKCKAGSKARVFYTRHDARRSGVNPLFRHYYLQLHRAIFVARLTMDLWREANPWMPESKCVVQHNSIPPTENAPVSETLRQRLGIQKSVPLLMFAGRVRRSKGCSTIVEALSMIKELPFCMVFVGKYKPEKYSDKLLKAAERFGIKDRIHFIGFASNVRNFIREADIALAPSIMRESSPLSQLEFMQAGKCIITTNNGGQTEFIRHNETGLIIDSDNAKQLAAAIKSVIEYVRLRLMLGDNAHAYFEKNLNYVHFINNMLAIYNDSRST